MIDSTTKVFKIYGLEYLHNVYSSIKFQDSTVLLYGVLTKIFLIHSVPRTKIYHPNVFHCVFRIFHSLPDRTQSATKFIIP